MGNFRSGRRPSEATMVAKDNLIELSTGEPIIIPNFSGIKDAAKKGSTATFLQTGDNISQLTNDSGYITSYTETDPVFLALSGGFLTAETDPVFLALSGGFLTAETDPIFLALSGNFLTSYTETDPVFLALSGNFITAEADPIFLALSGSVVADYLPLSLSGSWNTDLASGAAHFVDTTDPHGETLTQTNITSTGHFSGAAVSGATIKTLSDNDASGAAICRNILVGTEDNPGPANLYNQGTIYFKYTA